MFTNLIITLVTLLFVLLLPVACAPIIEEPGVAQAPEIFIFPTETEDRLISTEDILQDNCNGTAEASDTVERSHKVLRTLELGTEITVDADGRAGIPGVGEVGVGAAVASHYKVSYGSEDTVTRSVTVAAKEKSSIQHTIRQYEVWEKGEVLISAGDANQRLPYSFRRDFRMERLPPANIGCPGQAPPAADPGTPPIPEDTPPVPPEEPATEPPPTIATAYLEVVPPDDQLCGRHDTGFCGLVMDVTWDGIRPEDGYIYLVGYAPNYNPANGKSWYWISGTGFKPDRSRGSATISDGAFGNPGEYVEVYACQTPDKYEFSATVREIAWADPPACIISSSAKVLNTR